MKEIFRVSNHRIRPILRRIARWIGAVVGSETAASDRFLGEVLTQSPTPHVFFDNGSIADANAAAVRILGAGQVDELLNEPVTKFFPVFQPDGRLSEEGWLEQVETARRDGGAQFEWTLVRLDGAELILDVFLRDGELAGRESLFMACYDLTAIRAAQRRLVDSEQRFRDVSEAVGEFIWEVDAEGRYTYVSRRVVEFFGVPPEEVNGRSPMDWIHADDLDRIRRQSTETVRNRALFRSVEHRVRRADGKIIWVSASGRPRFDSNGVFLGYRGASMNVTERREYEAQLVLQKDAAEAADRAKSSFLAMMSHEIRTPLNSVLGFADLVLQSELTPEQREYLGTIYRSGDSLLRLLNDVLDFSKIESGRMDIVPEPTVPRECAEEVVGLYRLTAGAKGLRLSVREICDGGRPESVLLDRSRLRQILINLIGNAVKFTHSGHIEVRLIWRGGGILVIEFEDTGIGISEDLRRRLFQPFSQADSSATRKFGGTGLGLAISYRLAELMGGQLGLRSATPNGTCFYLELPVHVAVEAEAAAALSRFSPTRAHSRALNLTKEKLRVLVVDDNPINCRLTSRMLDLLGADPHSASGAEECFAILEARPIDLILMDIQMPEIDGLEATRRIRAAERDGGKRVRVVALTADVLSSDRDKCLAAGMDGYLTKPLRREDLARVLAEGDDDS